MDGIKDWHALWIRSNELWKTEGEESSVPAPSQSQEVITGACYTDISESGGCHRRRTKETELPFLMLTGMLIKSSHIRIQGSIPGVTVDEMK